MRIGDFEESNGSVGTGDAKMDIYITNDQNNRIIFCWKLGWFERVLVLFTGRMWHQVLLYDKELQQSAISPEKPLMDKGV